VVVITLGATNDPAGRQGARIRRRPKDRKAQITRAAAEAFSAHGYHATSMEAIATRVGISAPALYRHYPSKYDMFATVVGALGQQLVACTDFVDEVSDAELERDAAAVLDRVVDAIVTSAITNREGGGLYRWQDRYLQPDDKVTLMAQLSDVSRRMQRPLDVLRPELTSSERWMVSAALLSLAGSVVGHRLPIPDDEVKPFLLDAARALAATQLPQPADIEANRPSVWRIFTPDAGPHEALLTAAIMLFGKQGYTETSVTEIADAVGVPASGVYRYFSSKNDILTTGLQRAVGRITGEMSAIAGVFAEPREVVARLVEAFVATNFANPELAAVYDTERVNLAPAEREVLRDLERAFIDTWLGPLEAVRPDLDTVHARLLVHALGALVDDLGRLEREDKSDGNGPDTLPPGYVQACLRKLVESLILGTDES
jgi:AcrR family transcriptional regulator